MSGLLRTWAYALHTPLHHPPCVSPSVQVLLWGRWPCWLCGQRPCWPIQTLTLLLLSRKTKTLKGSVWVYVGHVCACVSLQKVKDASRCQCSHCQTLLPLTTSTLINYINPYFWYSLCRDIFFSNSHSLYLHLVILIVTESNFPTWGFQSHIPTLKGFIGNKVCMNFTYL